jgi:uncharacterized protein YbjT (DUF2867 family)
MTSHNGNGAPGGNKKIILVTGATGNQGGAAAAQLLTAGWRVRALTRDPASRGRPGARRRGRRGPAGDLDDPGSLRAATDGVFSVELEAPTLRDTARRILEAEAARFGGPLGRAEVLRRRARGGPAMHVIAAADELVRHLGAATDPLGQDSPLIVLARGSAGAGEQGGTGREPSALLPPRALAGTGRGGRSTRLRGADALVTGLSMSVTRSESAAGQHGMHHATPPRAQPLHYEIEP